MDVLPARNLPGKAEEWGRAVEDRLQALYSDTLTLDSGVDNGLRAFDGQLSVSARQVSELHLRTPEISSLASISVTGSNALEPFPRSYQTISFPAVEYTRTARIGVLGSFSGVDVNVRPFVRLTYDGRDIYKLTPGFDFAPPDGLAATAEVIIPGGVAPQFSLMLTMIVSDGVSKTVTLGGLTAYLTRGGAVV